jgi:hypothetical protein
VRGAGESAEPDGRGALDPQGGAGWSVDLHPGHLETELVAVLGVDDHRSVAQQLVGAVDHPDRGQRPEVDPTRAGQELGAASLRSADDVARAQAQAVDGGDRRAVRMHDDRPVDTGQHRGGGGERGTAAREGHRGCDRGDGEPGGPPHPTGMRALSHVSMVGHAPRAQHGPL